MLEIADRLLPLVAAGARLAVATAVDVIGSAPHLAGTSMALTEHGEVIGSVSGGCVEAAALADCRALLAGAPPRIRRHGFGDAAAASTGLACGGEVDVLVHPLGGAAVARELRRASAGRAAALGLVTAGPRTGAVVTADDDDPLASMVAAAVGGCGPEGTRMLVDLVRPARRMVIGGATETAVALAGAAAAAGFRVIVCDPRPAFTQPGRFPAAERVVTGRLHELLRARPPAPVDAVCVLGHDEELDPLALAVALESPAGYVGALGSRATAERRHEALRLLGSAEAEIARLRMPIGLDLGGRSAGETAVSILAEVLAVLNGAGAGVLTGGRGPIHRAADGRRLLRT